MNRTLGDCAAKARTTRIRSPMVPADSRLAQALGYSHGRCTAHPRRRPDRV
ncbi:MULTISPECIES: hypothetical protein [Parafrankia]|nr:MULTISPECIES: hypothetical protein [Parafrankia]MBE3205282.1 hypothetical protein [Parafrankia sp. CH37]